MLKKTRLLWLLKSFWKVCYSSMKCSVVYLCRYFSRWKFKTFWRACYSLWNVQSFIFADVLWVECWNWDCYSLRHGRLLFADDVHFECWNGKSSLQLWNVQLFIFAAYSGFECWNQYKEFITVLYNTRIMDGWTFRSAITLIRCWNGIIKFKCSFVFKQWNQGNDANNTSFILNILPTMMCSWATASC